MSMAKEEQPPVAPVTTIGPWSGVTPRPMRPSTATAEV